MKKACHFGIFDPKHWRSRTIQSGLKRAGFEVVMCQVDPREVRGFKKYLELYRKFRGLNEKFDVIVVGFPGYLAVILARLLFRGTIIFDAYISYFDGIRDRRNYSLYHPMMWVAWLVDSVSCLLSNVVLTINHAYKEFFAKTFFVPERKIEVLHKGADEEIFYPRSGRANERFSIGWWGSFIPLHGLPTIIEATRKLSGENYDFELIGGGQLKSQIRKAAEGLANVKFIDYSPQRELADKIANYDLVLGIFAPTPKAKRCVTNKVYEAMCMGKVIITEDSPANREIFTHKENVYLVEPGEAGSLADAIKALADDAALRQSLGQNARHLFLKRFTLKNIEEEFIGILRRHNV